MTFSVQVNPQAHMMWCCVGRGGSLIPDTVRRTKRAAWEAGLGGCLRNEKPLVVRCAVQLGKEVAVEVDTPYTRPPANSSQNSSETTHKGPEETTEKP